MRKILLLSAFLAASVSYAQTVTTFAGTVNDDPFNQYEAVTSNVDLLSTYFAFPNGICFDPSGNIYITERNKLRLITGQSKIHIRAGYPLSPTNSEGYKNGTSTQAGFRNPGGAVTDSDGNVYICDAENHCIRKVSKFVNLSNNQSVSTFAGALPSGNYGVSGSSNGTGTAARFNQPQGITIDGSGNMYVTDYLNFTIRKITPSGVVTTLAGDAGVDGTTDGTGSAAKFGGPWGIAMLDANHVVVTDPWNTNIRKVNISTGVTTTICGGSTTGHTDGTLSEATFKAPKGVVVIEGIIYVGDQNVIRAIDIDNDEVTTIAGNSSEFSVKDGNGSSAYFTEIDGMATDGKGVIYICENSAAVNSHVIRKMTLDHLVPRADFSANLTLLTVGQKTTLTDISTGSTVTSRTWTITPSDYTIHTGDLTTSSLEISFSKEGFYKVDLSITNQFGTSDVSKESYFQVSTTGSVSYFNANDLINLYPNPSTDIIKVDLDPRFVQSQTTMNIYDLQGHLIYSGSYSPTFNTSTLPSGMYYMSVTSETLKAVKRFTVSR